MILEYWDFMHFIPHSALAHDPVKNTQYLKDDTLYFRVSVEVAEQKPWLRSVYIQDATGVVAKMQEKSKTLKAKEAITFQVTQSIRRKRKLMKYSYPLHSTPVLMNTTWQLEWMLMVMLNA